MHYQAANYSPLWRLGHFLKSCFLYLWIGKAAYLFFGANAYNSYGLLARSFLVMRDGLLSMPDTLADVLSAVFSFMASLNSQLTYQLGYAPFSNAGETIPGLQDSLPLSASQMIWLVLLCVAVLSAVQFIVWMQLKKRGVPIAWQAPCIPDILQGKMKLLYWAICWLVIAALSMISLRYGVIAGIVTAVSLTIAMRMPVLAGLPLWLLEITKPGNKHSSWRSSRDSSTRSGSASAHGSQDHKDARDADEQSHEHSQANSGPLVDKLAQAHATFELSAKTITRDKLKNKYRSLMKKLHPDQEGSSRLAAIINADYDCLLEFYSWKR